MSNYNEQHPTVAFRVNSIELKVKISELGGVKKVLGTALQQLYDGMKDSDYIRLAGEIL